jgi:hypothetical protein
MKNYSIMKTALAATVFIAVYLLSALTTAASGLAGRELTGHWFADGWRGRAASPDPRFSGPTGRSFISLNSLEAGLDPRHFFRANCQHIINLAKVQRIEPWFSSSLMVHLEGNHQIEMSRRQGQQFRELRSL